ETPSERRSRPGGTPGTPEPPPQLTPTISPAPPVDEPPRTPAAANASPAPADDEPPPPVTTAPPVALDEEAVRPPIDAVVDPVCWDGWTYDEERRQCVRDQEPEPADKKE